MTQFVTFKGRVPVNLAKVSCICPVPTTLKLLFVFDAMNHECMNEVEWVLDDKEDYQYVLGKLNIKEL